MSSETTTRAAQMCTSYVAPMSGASERDVCLRCGWNHRREREKEEFEKMRKLIPLQQRAGIRLYYHDGLGNPMRDAVADIEMLLGHVAYLESRQCSKS